MRAIILAAAVTALTCCGIAARAGATSEDACRAKAVSTIDIIQCQKAALAQVEAGLKAAYGRAMAALPPDQRAKLLEAERRWVAFRQADCEAYYGQTTGTLASIQGGDCMIQHAKDRVRDLATFTGP